MKMKKQLIAAAALTALAGAAQAQMSLYGLVDMCYGKSLLADVFLAEKADVHSGGDNFSSECNSTTRVGIKGSYEVASGVKANFRFETAGIKSNGRVGEDGQAFFNRQAWAGLSGSLGEVRVGRQDSVPFQMMGDFDFNGQSNGVSAGAYSFIGPWATGRQSRSIQYIAPAMGGLSAQFGLRVKGNSQDGNKDQFSGAVKYGAGPLLVGVAFETKPDSAAKDFMSIAGSYDLGAAKVMASYTNAGAVNSGGFGKGYMLGVVAPVAGFNIGAHYANNSDNLLKIKSWELFINKEIFKNTYGYLEGGNWKASPTDGGATLFSLGAQKLKGSAASAGVIFVF
jgi:predicted porin